MWPRQWIRKALFIYFSHFPLHLLITTFLWSFLCNENLFVLKPTYRANWETQQLDAQSFIGMRDISKGRLKFALQDHKARFCLILVYDYMIKKNPAPLSSRLSCISNKPAATVQNSTRWNPELFKKQFDFSSSSQSSYDRYNCMNVSSDCKFLWGTTVHYVNIQLKHTNIEIYFFFCLFP